MKLVIVIIVISFFLDSIISNVIPIDTNIFNILFTLMSLIIIYPYFTKEDYTYYKICFGLGLVYDIVFTDTLLLNACLFLIIGIIIKYINIVLSNNFINVGVMALIIIPIYRIITYAILLITGNYLFNFNMLITSIFSSLLLNIIYVILVYIVTDIISKKKKILKIN